MCYSNRVIQRKSNRKTKKKGEKKGNKERVGKIAGGQFERDMETLILINKIKPTPTWQCSFHYYLDASVFVLMQRF